MSGEGGDEFKIPKDQWCEGYLKQLTEDMDACIAMYVHDEGDAYRLRRFLIICLRQELRKNWVRK